MDENNNEQMRSGDLDQNMEKGKQVVNNVGNVAKNGVNKIKGAKTKGNKPGEKVGVGKKIKAKKYQAQGTAETALGGSLAGAGLATQAAGLGTRALAQGIKGAGTLASLIPYAGPAIKAGLNAAAKSVDTAGKKMNDFGKKVRKKGTNKIKQGAHNIKRGANLEKTGNDIGPAGGKTGIGNLPNAPGNPKIPNVGKIIADAKRKSALKGGLLNPKKIRRLKIICIIIGIVSILIVPIIILLRVSSIVDRGGLNQGDDSNVPYVVKSQIMNQITIVSNGVGGYTYAFKDSEGNILTLDESMDNALKVLQKNESDALSDLGTKDEDKKELLKKLIMAEISTQYPDLSNSGLEDEVTGESSSDINGNVVIQRKDTSGNIIPLRYIDEAAFNQLIIDGSEDSMKYYTLKKSAVTNASGASYTGTDILSDWIASWENGGLFLYKKGQGSYDSWGVNGYITQDGQSYICRTDVGTGNGTLNYGFGIMVNQNGRPNNTEYFQKYGIDITNSQYLQESISTIPVNIVDSVKKDILQEKVNVISQKMSGYGITLTQEQLYALCGIAYQFGDGGANLDQFANLYKKYGNTEELRQNYTSLGGTKLFVKVQGGTNSEGIDRAAANWGLFHDGIYYAGSGGTLDKSGYGVTEVAQNGTNTPNVDTTVAVNVTGSDVKTQCWNFLKTTMGYSDAVAAGVMGNIQNESGFKPSADNGTHYGLCQWSKQYCPEVNGKDIQEQFEFFRKWITGSEFNIYAKNYKAGFNYDQFLQMTDPGEAAKAFAVTMERYGGGVNCSESNERAADAKKIFEEMNGTGGSATGITTLDNFLFIGDSRYSTCDTYIKSLGEGIKNAGVGSSNINEWIKVVENGGKGTVQRKSVDITGKYNGISVQLAANGIYKNVGNTESQMKTLLEKLQVLYPGTPIFVNSCMQVSQKNTSAGYDWDASIFKDNVNEFNNDISNYCNQVENLHYIDISDNLQDSEGYLKSEYTEDGLHCNNNGAKVFADNIKNAILNCSASSNTNTDIANNTDSVYTLVVANSSTVDTVTTDNYIYNSTSIIETTNGAIYPGTRFSETPATEIVNSSSTTTYSSTSADYQTALKNYTLYFDFLWAIFIDYGNRSLITSWADLGINSNVCITVYSDKSSTVSTSEQSKGTKVRMSYNESSKAATQDVYNVVETTTTTTTTVVSKPAITDANTWILKYENNAATYSEYQAKSQEVITEKIDPNDSEDNIIKILRAKPLMIDSLISDEYIIDKILKENEKISFMSEIYEYILNIAKNKDYDENLAKLTNLLDTNVFDLTNTTAITKKVLTYSTLTINDSDKELLYKFVEQVGEGCTAEEKEYITNVVLNRALSGKFGSNSVKKIINASYQFENYDSSKNDSITPSDETKTAVDNAITNGDKSNYAVYFATPETATKKGWDKSKEKKSTVTGGKYSFYTTEEVTKELKKYETTVTVSVGSIGGASDVAQKIVAWAESQVGNSSFYNRHHGYQQVATNYCAAFVECSYYEAGLEYYGGNAIELPHPNAIEYNSDGTVNWSNIPVGAILVSKGTMPQYGHVCLYVGNGYIIEAGGSTVKKTPIDESYGGKGHNCSPFVGWGFATHDQEDARSKLVTANAIGGNYSEGWTSNGAQSDVVRNTGIEGIYKAGDKQYNVYAQGYNNVWGNKSYWDGTYGSDACGITSTAIVLTGFGINITPEGVNSDGIITNGNTLPTELSSECAKYGLKQETTTDKNKVLQHLQAGNPVIFNVHKYTIGKNYYDGHYVTLLGIDSNGQILLGDPAGGGNNSGYWSQDKIFNNTGTWNAYLISK